MKKLLAREIFENTDLVKQTNNQKAFYDVLVDMDQILDIQPYFNLLNTLASI